MRRNFLIFLLALGALGVAQGQGSGDVRTQLANLTQDVALLSQQVGQLRLEVEQLRRENAQLRQQTANDERLRAELREIAVQAEARSSNLRRELLAADARQRKEIVAEVATQIEQLAGQTQKAIDAVAKASSVRADLPETVTFSDDFPKENGVLYEVQPGDTLSGIARKFNARIRDIQNANRIADPRALRVGQTLFVPRREND